MRNLKFHSIHAKNILCFGPEGIKLEFKNYGNIIQVTGINLDSASQPASNGSGKSSIQELISIALFGRTVKSPTKNKANQIMNVLADKATLEIEWDDFRALRTYTRNKSGITAKIQLWQNVNNVWVEITQPTDDIKAKIEKDIGLSHHAFCNVVIFDDSSVYSFLEADTPTKRSIVENLLDLDRYREYHSNCKDLIKYLKDDISSLSKEYSQNQSEVDACIRRIETVKQQDITWQASKRREIQDLESRISAKQSKLETSDAGQQLLNWQKSQERLATLSDEITDLESKRDKVQTAITLVLGRLNSAREDRQNIRDTIAQHNQNLSSAKNELDKSLKLINSLENFEDGTACPYCYGIINRDNYGHVLNNTRQTAHECRTNIDSQTLVAQSEKEKLDQKNSMIVSIEEKIIEAESKIAIFEDKIRKNRKEISTLSAISKPEGNVVEQVLEAEIVELKKQLINKKQEADGQSPYKELVDQSENEKTQKQNLKDQKALELAAAEAKMPYYQFWLEAFGDNGIRKFVIDGIIPALNSRVSYCMQILTGDLIEITFDNKLEETIIRNANPASYSNMSKSEKGRINLAVSQAFAYVMMINSGICPNIVFLDEITGGAIDKAGIPAIHNLIFELAKERQVFITTHDETLINMLYGCESITLKKQNDITVLVS